MVPLRIGRTIRDAGQNLLRRLFAKSFERCHFARLAGALQCIDRFHRQRIVQFLNLFAAQARNLQHLNQAWRHRAAQLGIISQLTRGVQCFNLFNERRADAFHRAQLPSFDQFAKVGFHRL